MLVVLTVSAFAQQSVSLSGVTTMSPCESERPSLTFHAMESGTLRAALDCGPHHFEVNQDVASGTDVTLAIGVPPGEYTCSGEMVMELANGATVQQGLNLEVACLPPLTWQTSYEDVNLAENTLVVHPSRPLAEARVEILTVGGEVGAASDADLSDPSNPSFSWSGDFEEVKIAVRGKEKHGFAWVLELTPWHYAIPHEDVVFASGSPAIEGAEVPKLEKTWADTVDVLNKYGSIVQIQLYVGGYTDTVGAGGSNQALSERRARAIATWFRNAGFSGEIFFQGFGERGQAVTTADEVDEVRNRRAVYILAAERPPPSPDLPGTSWNRL
jgi:hypothetical protein